jgi:hypothetical protein
MSKIIHSLLTIFSLTRAVLLVLFTCFNKCGRVCYKNRGRTNCNNRGDISVTVNGTWCKSQCDCHIRDTKKYVVCQKQLNKG